MFRREYSKNSKFPKTAIILIAVFLLVAALTVCGVLFIKRSGSSGENDGALVSELTSEETLRNFATDYVGQNLSKYESLDSALISVGKALENINTEVKDNGDGTYTILVNGENGFSAAVTETILGRKAELTSYNLGTEYFAVLPHGATGTANGNALSDGKDTDYIFLSQYEESLSADYRAEKYSLGICYGIPSVSASLDGNELLTPFVDGDTLYFAYPLSYTKDITLNVPLGTVILVNGIRVTDTSSCTVVKYPFLSRFEDGLDECLTSYEINLGKFFAEPKIEALYNGKLLTPSEEGGYTYPLPDGNTLAEYTITAPSDAIVKINGVSLGTSDITVPVQNYALLTYEYTVTNEDGTTYTENMTDRYAFDTVPTQTVYKVSGLYFEPEIKCYGPDGTEYPVYDYLSTEYNIVFKVAETATIPTNDIKTIKYLAKYFARYVCEASTTTPAYYNGLRGTSSRGSPAYVRVQQMWNKRDYQCKISSFGEIKYENYYKYSDTLYSVTAIIPYTTKSSGTALTYEMRVEFLYVFSGSTRLMVNFNVLDEILE